MTTEEILEEIRAKAAALEMSLAEDKTEDDKEEDEGSEKETEDKVDSDKKTDKIVSAEDDEDEDDEDDDAAFAVFCPDASSLMNPGVTSYAGSSMPGVENAVMLSAARAAPARLGPLWTISSPSHA